ncbi:MAG: potassium transporter TrkG [Gammaproteobacteria bacterium]|jgi:trk system potassium uptake protein TrkH
MSRFVGSLAVYPARALFAWYLLLVLAGAILLSLPVCHRPGLTPISLSDALFMATSAACVTGLVVRDVAEFSLAGQVVLLLLIQLGGIGIMTLATLFLVSIIGHQTLRHLAAAQQTVGADLGADLRVLLSGVVRVVLTLEAIGFVVLLIGRWGNGPLPDIAWWALFHAVSAFCNAGLTLSPDSLQPWAGQWWVTLPVALLLILGGLGYPVLVDLFTNIRHRGPHYGWRGLSFHSRLTLTTSVVLLLLGALAFLVAERNASLADLEPAQASILALFESATARTAGFSTVPTGTFSTLTLFVLALLMFIGAGPSSTAGGVKVTTVSALFLYGLGRLRGRHQATAFGHAIPERLIAGATVVLIVGIGLITLAVALILLFEDSRVSHQAAGPLFIQVLFETVSAFGTVGLSTGITRELGEASRLVIVAMMFIGRIGPLALVMLLLPREHGPHIKYPEGDLQIG